MTVPLEVAARAAANYTVDENGCHISDYSVIESGYGRVTWQHEGKQRTSVAHRAAWVHHHGQIPEDLTLDHKCRQRRCVNIEHLRLLTHAENSRRNHGVDYPLGWSCRNDHPASSRYTSTSGRVRCRDCAKETTYQWRANNVERNRLNNRAWNQKWRAENPEKVERENRARLARHLRARAAA